MEGKVAVVTGANSGIGEAISKKFASLGVKVTICGRDAQRLSLVFDKLVEIRGGDQTAFLIVQGDVNEQKVRKQIIEETMGKFGRLDILVLNAGINASRQSVLHATEETYDTIINTNLKSIFFLTQLAVPHLEKHKGNIIIISSASTHMINHIAPIYSIGKMALDHLTELLAFTLGEIGIRVNSVNPSFIPTRILRFMGEKQSLVLNMTDKSEFDKQVIKTRPVNCDDVAEAVVFLASDMAALITGVKICVDGGRRFSAPPESSLKSVL